MKKIFIFALAVFISLGTANAKELTLEEKEALINKIAPGGTITIKGEKLINPTEEDYWGSTETFFSQTASKIINK